MPWADLAGILVTKDDLRGSGWSEAKIKLHLGEPKGRHPSTHFRNPLGQPYWTGPNTGSDRTLTMPEPKAKHLMLLLVQLIKGTA